MSRIYETFEGEKKGRELGELCLALLAEQKDSWTQLRQAYEALKQAKMRDLACEGFSVRLLYNPGRFRSTAAPVSDADIARRPCFLCEGHLPDAQKALLYRNAYLILANPMPVIPGHFTIAHVSHRPQAIAGHVRDLLDLTADFGRDWIILYNGPRCGASAPDHLHFQAIPSGQTPIEHELREERRWARNNPCNNGVPSWRIKDMGREVIIFRGEEREALVQALHRFLLVQSANRQGWEEPMLNLVAFFDDRMYTILLFPRRRHRPGVYFNEGDDRIVVSPAVVEMAGLIVTPFEKDFERLDRRTVEAIYSEVSLGRDR
jgi:hypothetical protein